MFAFTITIFIIAISLSYSLDTNKAITNFADIFRDYETNPDATHKLLTKDAQVCMNGQCSDLRKSWEDSFKNVKIFDYEYEVLSVGGNEAMLICWDYVETNDGCNSMFTCHCHYHFDDDGKVNKIDLVMSDEQLAKYGKCLAPKEEL